MSSTQAKIGSERNSGGFCTINTVMYEVLKYCCCSQAGVREKHRAKGFLFVQKSHSSELSRPFSRHKNVVYLLSASPVTR